MMQPYYVNVSLTDEMQEILEEIDDIDGGYGNVVDI